MRLSPKCPDVVAHRRSAGTDTRPIITKPISYAVAFAVSSLGVRSGFYIIGMLFPLPLHSRQTPLPLHLIHLTRFNKPVSPVPKATGTFPITLTFATLYGNWLGSLVILHGVSHLLLFCLSSLYFLQRYSSIDSPASVK
jgi:hypothetical protein